MRKFIVSLLAVCLLMSACIQPVGNMLHAQEINEETQGEVDSASGKIKVEMISTEALAKEENFTLQLSKDGYDSKEVISLKANEDDNLNSDGIATFSNLEDGTYTLTITSDTNKYQEYKQEFVVDGLEYAIQLHAGEKEIDEQQKAHPGVIRYRTYGDKELEEILQEIEKRTDTSHYNLNGDNTVDLLDLQLFSASYTTSPKENILSTIETSVPSSIVSGSVDSDTATVDGDLNSVVNEESTSSVVIQSKQEITKETPLNVSFSLGNESESVALEGMNIKTGAADKQIDEGNVLVYVEGQEEPLSIPIVKENEMNVYRRSGGVAILHKDGSISVDFGGQIAVKKVTIQITNTTS